MSIDIESPLSLEGFGFEPRSQQRLKLQDDVNWAFAVLTGRRGNKQYPLAADADSRLHVNPGHADYTPGDDPPSEPEEVVMSMLYAYNILGTGLYPLEADDDGLYTYDYVAASHLNIIKNKTNNIEGILDDVWDDVNHALQTTTV